MALIDSIHNGCKVLPGQISYTEWNPRDHEQNYWTHFHSEDLYFRLLSYMDQLDWKGTTSVLIPAPYKADAQRRAKKKTGIALLSLPPFTQTFEGQVRIGPGRSRNFPGHLRLEKVGHEFQGSQGAPMCISLLRGRCYGNKRPHSPHTIRHCLAYLVQC